MVEGIAGHFHSLVHLNIMLIKERWKKYYSFNKLNTRP